MAVQISDSGIIQTTAKEFPVIAVNVLDKLGYQVQRASKQLDQILAIERVEEQIGRDWWRQEYRVVIQWRTASSGGVLVNIDLEERKGGASETECQQRCDKIILALQKDAERAAHTLANREKSTAYGAARWGTEAELKANDYYQSKADPKRLIIGRTADNKYIQVPELWTHAHALSEFIRKRGRTASDQPQQGQQQGGQQQRKGQGRDKKRTNTPPNPQDDIKLKPHPGPKRDVGPPQYDDI